MGSVHYERKKKIQKGIRDNWAQPRGPIGTSALKAFRPNMAIILSKEGVKNKKEVVEVRRSPDSVCRRRRGRLLYRRSRSASRPSDLRDRVISDLSPPVRCQRGSSVEAVRRHSRSKKKTCNAQHYGAVDDEHCSILHVAVDKCGALVLFVY